MTSRSFRYDIRRPLEYRYRGPDGPVSGHGTTVNISRQGVLFEPEGEVGLGSRIELNVDLGSLLDETPPVRLYVQGVTVRKDSRGVAVSIRKHRLRRAKPPAGEAPHASAAL